MFFGFERFKFRKILSKVAILICILFIDNSNAGTHEYCRYLFENMIYHSIQFAERASSGDWVKKLQQNQSSRHSYLKAYELHNAQINRKFVIRQLSSFDIADSFDEPFLPEVVNRRLKNGQSAVIDWAIKRILGLERLESYWDPETQGPIALPLTGATQIPPSMILDPSIHWEVYADRIFDQQQRSRVINGATVPPVVWTNTAGQSTEQPARIDTGLLLFAELLLGHRVEYILQNSSKVKTFSRKISDQEAQRYSAIWQKISAYISTPPNTSSPLPELDTFARDTLNGRHNKSWPFLNP
jgi:hypothetical protein